MLRSHFICLARRLAEALDVHSGSVPAASGIWIAHSKRCSNGSALAPPPLPWLPKFMSSHPAVDYSDLIIASRRWAPLIRRPRPHFEEAPAVTRLVVRPLAEADLDEAFAWYESRSVSLGVDVLRAVDACFDAIVTTPLAYPVVYRGARPALLRHFPYAVRYMQGTTALKFSSALTRACTRAAGDGARDPQHRMQQTADQCALASRALMLSSAADAQR